jgi:hypothetical protein
MPCVVCGSRPSEAHHRTGGGTGTKTSDRQTMPLCTAHHRQLHDLNGHFRGWLKADLQSWQTLNAIGYLGRYMQREQQHDDPSVF